MPQPNPSPQGFVSSLVTIGAARLAECYPEAGRTKARRVMRAVAADVCNSLGGSKVHVPTGAAQRLQRRDVLIRKQYATDGPDGARRLTAARAQQLAREHGLTARRLRSIVAPVNPAARQ